MLFNDIRENIDTYTRKLSELHKNYPNSQVEVEIRFTKYQDHDLTKSDFLRFRETFERYINTDEAITKDWTVTNTNDIVHSYSSSLRIEGFDVRNRQIQTGVSKVNMRKISVVTSNSGGIVKTPFYSPTYPFRMGFALELSGVDFSTEQGDKEYRQRSRRSYTFKDLFRIDSTIVEDVSKNQVSKIHYELEMEFLQPFTDVTAAIYSANAEWVIKIINETRILYTIQEKDALIVEVNDMMTNNVAYNVLQKTWVNQPVDLTWDDLKIGRNDGLFPQKGDNEVLKANYTVTVKLDGVRIFVYFSATGVYLLNPLAKLICRIYEQEIPRLTGTLLDGELIIKDTEGVHNAQIYEVYLFDCLTARIGEQIHDLRHRPHKERLQGTRLAAGIVYNVSVTEGKLVLFTKKFYEIVDRESFYLGNRNSLQKVEARDSQGNNVRLKLSNDGLLFTYVGGYLEGRVSQNKKWKPTNQLTIDFLVQQNRDGVPSLFVKSYSKEKGSILAEFSGAEGLRFDPTIFKMRHLVDQKEIVVGEDQIVEFRFDYKENLFVPIRIRNDKVEPNSYLTAAGIWKLINHPIQKGIMLGNIKGARILDLMRAFHNNEKRNILDRICDRPKINEERPILFDIGSGVGGDIDKWKFAGQKGNGFNVIALEPSKDRVEQLSKRILSAKMQDRVNILEGDVRNAKKIRDKVNLLSRRKIDAVTSFHSLTFLFDEEKSIDSLLSTCKGILRQGGVFVCMALDGKLIHRQLGESAQISVPGITIRRSSENPRKISVQLVGVRDESLRGGQEEWLVDFDYLITQFEANGFELLPEFDYYLDTDAILNDSELWWSQMTRVVGFRYVGIDQQRKEDNLLELKRLLMKAAPKSLGINQIEKLNNSQNSVFSVYDLWTVGVAGDGSCFLHALLYCLYAKYRNMESDERKDFVQAIRRDLTQLFTPEAYNALAKGELSKLGKDDNNFSYNVVKTGLLNYDHWFGLEFLEFVSNAVGTNIHLVWWHNDRLEVYRHGADDSVVFKEGRNSIVLLWQGNSHFQPVGRKDVDGTSISFVFEDGDDMIRLFQQQQ